MCFAGVETCLRSPRGGSAANREKSGGEGGVVDINSEVEADMKVDVDDDDGAGDGVMIFGSGSSVVVGDDDVGSGVSCDFAITASKEVIVLCDAT